MKKLAVGFGFIITLFFQQTIFAATTTNPAIVPSVEPGNVSNQISSAYIAPKPQAAAPTVSKPEKGALPLEALTIKLKLNKLIIDGNTIYSDQTLLAMFPKSMGSQVTLGDIQNFTDAITQKYRNAGYVLSKAILPAQHIKQGVVHIQVVEGYVASVNVQGNISDRARALLTRYGQKVVNKKPLQIRDLERYTLLANDIPGMDVKAILSPSKTTAGAADLTLVASQKPIDAFASYDNRGTRYIGPLRTIAGIYANTAWGGGTSTGVKAATAVTKSTNQLQYLEFEHKQLLGTEGFLLDFDGQYTRTQPGFLLDGTDTIGYSKSATLTGQYPLIRERSQSLYAKGGLVYVDTNLNSLGNQIYMDHIRAVELGSIYDLYDRFLGANEISGNVTQGLAAFGASSANDPVSRSDAKPGFTKLNLDISRLQALTQRFSLMLQASGQYAFSPLYSYEQMAYGGLPFGSAYDPAELVGDRGVLGRAELRLDTLPFNKTNVQYYIFYDGGVLWNIDTTNQFGQQTGTSAGVGTRIQLLKHLNVNLELAKPLNRDVAALQAAGENSRAWRGFFTIGVNV